MLCTFVCFSRSAVPRRAVVHATSNAKSGKQRFDMMAALARDRDRIERNKKLPWREKLEDLKVYPWKFFIAFMIFWSWLGTFAVPYIKGMRPGELPSVGEGKEIPQEIREKAMPMPRFSHTK
ncbi:hypothetical protein STCU_00860 [Strigomonas culicis]|uniref:Uncharacterized protein n=1 Tax=Strigomonas culicis TaxID=28005 RepID=S9WJ02_9TRYP|nr:hypothetical protein STCU_00860 [Strigomonas culicis]|eukprot:EPY35890.1 hypothetical protein STCU_00860 [Strigomonas culicis]